MRKRDWLLVLSLVPAIWLLDFATKHWALASIHSLHFYGPLGFILRRNPGAILGTFSDLPPLLRVVSLSTGGAFLIFIYGILQYLLPMRSIRLRIGMSILLGGILGNVTDRIIWGSVVDYIVIGSPRYLSPAFNIADAVQWIGYALVVFSLIKEGHLIWPDQNYRKQLWINPRFQLKYVAILILNGMAFAIITGVFAFTYLKMTIADLIVGPSQPIQHRFLMPFLETYGLISLGFAITLFSLGRILSHRTAGPIYAFEKFLEDVLSGKDRPLKLRAGDEFKHLEDLAERIRSNLIKPDAENPPETPTTMTGTEN